MIRLPPRGAATLAGLLLGASAPALAQEPAPLVETERVTAFDLLVELFRPGKPGRSVPPAASLAAAEFTVLWDGRPLPVVSLARGAEDPEPWRLVVYIDRQLASDHTIRWAAMELARRARRLTELGEVEIVVAEPEPRRVLAPSRDADLVDQSLSGIFLAPGGEAALVAQREAFRITYPEGPREDGGGAARRAERQEHRLLRRQMDHLLGWLAEDGPPTSRRALLVVADGWDLDPEAFYSGGGPAADPPPAAELAGATGELADTLAAYGWIVAALAPPPPPVGTGRFGVLLLPDAGFPWLFAFKLRSIEVWLDGNRKPKRADALVELGDALRRQGKLEEAVETYEQAIYHYYDHPKTARRQAAALVALGETLEQQGEPRRARTAYRAATVFDGELAARFPFIDARLEAPGEPLEWLAAATAGGVVTDPGELDRLLVSLADRVRLTAQLAGRPDGELHRLEARIARSDLALRHPAAARWGTPPAIASLRLRQLLAEGSAIGELEIETLSASRSADGTLAVDLAVTAAGPGPEVAEGGGELLVSWASGGVDGPIRYRVRAATMPGLESGAARARLSVELPAEHPWLAMLAEEPASGAWGGATVELAGD